MRLEGIHFAIMGAEHLDQVAALEEACFSHPWTKKSLEKELSNRVSAYIVSCNEQKEVVGYAGFWLVLDEIQIMRVAVHPDYRQRGIAEKMLRKLEAEWLDYDVALAYLEVRISNKAAQQLYRKLGYEEKYVRRKYYDNREDALIMEKRYDTSVYDDDSIKA